MTAPREVRVELEPAYIVTVGADLLDDLGAGLGSGPGASPGSGLGSSPGSGPGSILGARRLALISDTNVGARYGARVALALEAGGAEVVRIDVLPGEGAKSVATWEHLLRKLADAGVDRAGAVVALGGGIVGDVAGFVAASYMRGVPWIQLPTSLLAMVDASVGGKTAINLPEGKNLVGAFWQPRAVIADVATLATLPDREFRQGGVELYKHAMLAEPDLLELFGPDFDRDTPHATLIDAVARSVAIKADVVAQDEHEHGVRAHLNLGHSLGHALEGVTQHAVPHGDAVAYGLLFSALLSRQRGWTDLRGQALRLLRWLGPTPLPDLEVHDLAPYLARDKKNLGGRQRFVLLRDLGQPVVVDDVTDAELERAWHGLREATHDLGA